ncbi:hypothetical protein Tco_1533817 [Tanacetum coccineum]
MTKVGMKVDLVKRRRFGGGKEEDVVLDELGEGGKGVVSKIGEFGEDVDSGLLGERVGEILSCGGEGGRLWLFLQGERTAKPRKSRVKDADKEGTRMFRVMPDGGPLLFGGPLKD